MPQLASFATREFRLFATDAEFLGRIDALRCTAGCDTGTAVPEPGSMVLEAAALSALVACARRRGRQVRC